MGSSYIKVRTDIWKLSDGSFFEGEYKGTDANASKVAKSGFEYKVDYLEKIGYMKYKKRIDKNISNSIVNPDYRGNTFWNLGDIVPKLIGLIILIAIGSCFVAISNISNNSPNNDDFLNLSKEEVYELCNSYANNSKTSTFEECLKEFGY